MQQSRQGGRHSWGTVPKQSLIFELLYAPDHQIYTHFPWFIHHRVTTERGKTVKSKYIVRAVFLRKHLFLINAIAQVCMMTEIRRGEEYQVGLRGWAEFMAPSPQRNYLTSLLIKSAYRAAHYNGRLIYSVYFKLSAVQWRFMPVSNQAYPPRSALSLQAHKHYNIHDSSNMGTDSRIKMVLVFEMH